MTGLLCAAGIAGSAAFCIGWQSDANDEAAPLLVCGGLGLLAVAAVGGVIRAFV